MEICSLGIISLEICGIYDTHGCGVFITIIYHSLILLFYWLLIVKYFFISNWIVKLISITSSPNPKDIVTKINEPYIHNQNQNIRHTSLGPWLVRSENPNQSSFATILLITQTQNLKVSTILVYLL